MARWEPRGWRRIRLAVIARDGGLCWLCGQPGATTVDHVVPRSLGGTHNLTNLKAAHYSCNSARQDSPVMPRANVSDRWG